MGEVEGNNLSVAGDNANKSEKISPGFVYLINVLVAEKSGVSWLSHTRLGKNIPAGRRDGGLLILGLMMCWQIYKKGLNFLCHLFLCLIVFEPRQCFAPIFV